MAIDNVLYLAVLPLIRVPARQLGIFGMSPGWVQEYLTLQGDKEHATRFFQDELNHYLETFKASIRFLTGGHVTGYDVLLEDTGDGRMLVKVVQHVA